MNRRADVSEHICRDVNIVVTDVSTLDVLLRASKPMLGLEMSRVRKLEIVANVPMDVITAVEIKSTGK